MEGEEGGRKREKKEEKDGRGKRKGVFLCSFSAYMCRELKSQRISMPFEPELELGPLEPLLSDPRQATASMTQWGNGGTWQWEGKMNQA